MKNAVKLKNYYYGSADAVLTQNAFRCINWDEVLGGNEAWLRFKSVLYKIRDTYVPYKYIKRSCKPVTYNRWIDADVRCLRCLLRKQNRFHKVYKRTRSDKDRKRFVEF